MKVFSIITPSNKEFDNTINDIFQSSDYKYLKSSLADFIQTSKERISQFIKDIINKTILNIKSKDVVSNNLANIFMIIGLLLITAIVILIILKVSKTFDKREKIKEILGEKILNKTTPSSLRLLAVSFEAKGDFRQAIRYHFISLLFLMHQKNVIYLDETKTNEEIYKYLEKNKFSEFLAFKYLINDFNSSWYGHRLITKKNYDMVLQNINLIWSEVLVYEERQ